MEPDDRDSVEVLGSAGCFGSPVWFRLRRVQRVVTVGSSCEVLLSREAT